MVRQSRTRWIVGMAALALVGAGSAVFLRRSAQAGTPVVAAPGSKGPYALLLVERSERRLLPRATSTPFDDKEFDVFRKTQMTLLKSRAVFAATLKRPEVHDLKVLQAQSNPVAWLEEVIEVEETGSPELIRVRLRGGPADEAAVILDALIDVFITTEAEKAAQDKRDRLTNLDQIRVEQREKVRQSKELLKKLAEHLGPNDNQGSVRQAELIGRYGDLRRQQSVVQLERLRAEIRLKLHESRRNDLDKERASEASLAAAAAADPERSQLARKLSEWQAKKAQYESLGVDPVGTPAYLAIVKQEQLCKEQLEKRTAEVAQEVTRSSREKKQAEWEAQLTALQNEFGISKELEKDLTRRIEDLKESVEKIETTSVELEQLKSDVAQDEKILDKVSDEYVALQIEMHSRLRVSQLQKAVQK